ncbi:MAG: helix-turn-helix domain-containing protein [Rhizobiaceae bacterium]|nr:helix-turn-helix domain-containing protein [Rhizobiaceae bacterium]
MKNSNRPVIDAILVGTGNAGRVVGQSLQGIRQAVGLTQLEMANRMGIGQGAISKIERRGDIQVSSLQRYVEALGANLRIDATFDANSEFAKTVRSERGERSEFDGQYVLPIFGNSYSDRRDIVLSVRPGYSKKILLGTKTIELRRRFPLSAPSGTVIYLYSTAPVMALVGAAEIDTIQRLKVGMLWQRYGKAASIKKGDFDQYFEGQEEGYALKLSNPREFARPLRLPELRERFGFKAPQSFLYVKPDLQKALHYEYANVSY